MGKLIGTAVTNPHTTHIKSELELERDRVYLHSIDPSLGKTKGCRTCHITGTEVLLHIDIYKLKNFQHRPEPHHIQDYIKPQKQAYHLFGVQIHIYCFQYRYKDLIDVKNRTKKNCSCRYNLFQHTGYIKIRIFSKGRNRPQNRSEIRGNLLMQVGIF
jgi:hypothetical protein